MVNCKLEDVDFGALVKYDGYSTFPSGLNGVSNAFLQECGVEGSGLWHLVLRNADVQSSSIDIAAKVLSVWLHLLPFSSRKILVLKKLS